MGSLHFVTCCTSNGSEDVWEKNQGVGDAKKSVSLENAKKSCLGYFDISKFSSVQFQDGIYALGKAHMRSIPSLGSFPNVTSEKQFQCCWSD